MGKVSETGLVLGVIGADVHAIGNKVLDYALRERGFPVTNLGVMVSQREFIEAAIETNASAILVASLYGHGEMDCRGFREQCIEAGLEDIVLYVGGNLVVGKTEFETVRQKFLDMGFNRVYAPGTAIEDLIFDLETDFGLEHQGAD
jgi:methylaspartate mutase sigma subunit